MATKRKTAKKAVHKIVRRTTKHTEPTNFWRIIFVGALAGLLVGAGFNYSMNKTDSASAFTLNGLKSALTQKVYLDSEKGNDANNTGMTIGSPWKNPDKAARYINSYSGTKKYFEVRVVNRATQYGGNLSACGPLFSAIFERPTTIIGINTLDAAIYGSTVRPTFFDCAIDLRASDSGVSFVNVKNASIYLGDVVYDKITTNMSVNYVNFTSTVKIDDECPLSFGMGDAPCNALNAFKTKNLTISNINATYKAPNSYSTPGLVAAKVINIDTSSNVVLNNINVTGLYDSTLHTFARLAGVDTITTKGNVVKTNYTKYEKINVTNGKFLDE